KQPSRNRADGCVRSAERPHLRLILRARTAFLRSDGWHVIFQFAEHSQRCVDVARLKGKAEIVGLGPGDVNVFPGGIYSEVSDHERSVIARVTQVADPPGSGRCADPKLVLAFSPHFVADEVVVHDESFGPDGTHEYFGLVAKKCRYQHISAVRQLNQMPEPYWRSRCGTSQLKQGVQGVSRVP